MRFTPLLVILLLSLSIQANTTLYLFYITTCPHCHAELEFLQNISSEYPSLEIKKFAIDISTENLSLMNRFAKAYSVPADYGVPQTYVGNEVVLGYWNYDTHGKLIEELIQNCSKNGCEDPLSIVQETETGKAVNTTRFDKELVEFPIIGIVDMGAIPLTYQVIVLLLLFGLIWLLIKRIRKSFRSSS